MNKKPVNPPVLFSEIHEPTEFTAQQRVVALESGITLRDLFAAFALQGTVASGAPVGDATATAWRLADLMLEKREGKE